MKGHWEATAEKHTVHHAGEGGLSMARPGAERLTCVHSFIQPLCQVFSEHLLEPGAMLGDRNITMSMRDRNGAAVLGAVNKEAKP